MKEEKRRRIAQQDPSRQTWRRRRRAFRGWLSQRVFLQSSSSFRSSSCYWVKRSTKKEEHWRRRRSPGRSRWRFRKHFLSFFLIRSEGVAPASSCLLNVLPPPTDSLVGCFLYLKNTRHTTAQVLFSASFSLFTRQPLTRKRIRTEWWGKKGELRFTQVSCKCWTEMKWRKEIEEDFT